MFISGHENYEFCITIIYLQEPWQILLDFTSIRFKTVKGQLFTYNFKTNNIVYACFWDERCILPVDALDHIRKFHTWHILCVRNKNTTLHDNMVGITLMKPKRVPLHTFSLLKVSSNPISTAYMNPESHVTATMRFSQPAQLY